MIKLHTLFDSSGRVFLKPFPTIRRSLMTDQCPEQLKYLIAPPKTLPAAVERLLVVLSNEQKLMIALMTEKELADLQNTLGIKIRKAFSLDDRENSLLIDCGTTHPDKAATKIVKEVWKTLKIE